MSTTPPDPGRHGRFRRLVWFLAIPAALMIGPPLVLCVTYWPGSSASAYSASAVQMMVAFVVSFVSTTIYLLAFIALRRNNTDD